MIRANVPAFLSPTCAALATALLLSGCAASTNYPSLARRDAERVNGSATAATAAADAIPVLPPASADLTTRLASLIETARKAHTSFETRRAATERAVSGAGGVTSDSWSAAQVALSSLQTARSGALTALAELDRLYVDARAANPEQVSPTAAAIGAARDQVDGWVAAETTVIARLDSRLKS